ncbi:hypothetical protein RN001_000194 [Aquatica leii]|uniref:SCAN domain-containing protein n=1 Tax=Aquatica leii TaxID=1421715 RepID=A0AAN7QLW8_9COLE|nr:hypothetical protein RN001_000194 [Aquatica leii]
MFGCKAKVGLSTLNLPEEVVDSLVTDEDLENVKQQIEDAINAATSSANEPAAVAPKQTESRDYSAHSCGSCGNNVHAICGISCEAEEGYGGKFTCRLCHNKQEIRNKRSAAHANAKFPPAKVRDNVRIRIQDVDRGRSDPQSVLAVVMNVEGGFYKL